MRGATAPHARSTVSCTGNSEIDAAHTRWRARQVYESYPQPAPATPPLPHIAARRHRSLNLRTVPRMRDRYPGRPESRGSDNSPVIGLPQKILKKIGPLVLLAPSEGSTRGPSLFQGTEVHRATRAHGSVNC